MWTLRGGVFLAAIVGWVGCSEPPPAAPPEVAPVAEPAPPPGPPSEQTRPAAPVENLSPELAAIEREFDKNGRFDAFLTRQMEREPNKSSEEFLADKSDFERDGWEEADRIVASLDLKPGMVVADVGAGSGYYSLRFAPRVRLGEVNPAQVAEGKAPGMVFALDVSPPRVTFFQNRITRIKAEEPWLPVDNIKVYQSKYEDTLLPPDQIDLAFLSNIHFFALPTNDEVWVPCMQSLTRAMKKGGRVILIETMYQPPDICYPPDAPATAAQLKDFPLVEREGRQVCDVSKEMLIARFKKVGLTYTRELEHVAHSWFLEFRKD